MRSSSYAAVLVAALLAGCGGGGSSPSPGVPSGTSPQSSLSATDVARAGSDAAFDAIDTGDADAAALTIGTNVSAMRRSPQSAAHGCKNRTTRTVTVNADGSVTVETKHYFDDACTNLERDAVAVYASSGGTATLQRTITTFNQAALQLGVRKSTATLTGSTANGAWTIRSAFYAGTSATPLTQLAHAASLSSSAYAATTARIANDPKPSVNASYGHQSAVDATVTLDASNDVTFTGTRNGAAFKAALNGLTISSAPPFTLSGGTQLGTSSLNGSVTFDADGNLTAVSLNGTLLGGNTIAVSTTTAANGAVTVSGTITSPSGAPVATFTTDASGDGILTLANGTQVPIVDWHVVW